MFDYSRLLKRLAENNEIEAPELDYQEAESDIHAAINKLPDENRSIPQQQEQVAAEPEQSAIDQYKQYLKDGPSSQERWGRVLAAAADTFGGGGGAFTKMQSGIPTEGSRLKQAAAFELSEKETDQKYRLLRQKVRDKNATANDKKQEKDYAKIEDVRGILSGNNTRKGSLMKKSRENLKFAKHQYGQLLRFKAGDLTFDRPSANQTAAVFGKLMGTATGSEVLKSFQYDSILAAKNDFVSYLTGDPMDAATPEQMEEIVIMLGDTARNEQQAINTSTARLLNSITPRLKRNPDLLDQLNYEYQDQAGEITYDKKAGRYDPVLVTRTAVKRGKDQSFQAEGAEDDVAASDNLSIFRRLTGRK